MFVGSVQILIEQIRDKKSERLYLLVGYYDV
jgi:hypothetical protein